MLVCLLIFTFIYFFTFLSLESGPKIERPGSTIVDAKALFEAEAAKAKLKISVVSGTMDVSIKDFMALFVDESAPFSYKRYLIPFFFLSVIWLFFSLTSSFSDIMSQ
jgi:hypothetical protein